MRRQDREITDFNEIVAVMRQCDVVRLGLKDEDGYPYILPLNFGMDVIDDQITFYFHSALEGKKVNLIRDDNRATFEMDCNHQLQYFPERGMCTMAFESVMGRGYIEMVEDDKKEYALSQIMEQYHPEGQTYYNPAAMPRTMVYCLKVTEMTGKRKPLKK